MRTPRALALCITIGSTSCYTGLEAKLDGAATTGVASTPGADDDSEGSGDESSTGEPEEQQRCDPGSARVWRLTAEQYDATLAAIFQFDAATTWTASFPDDPESYFFANNADALVVAPALVLELSRTAERVAQEVFADPTAHLHHLWPCDPATLDAPDRACTDAFVEQVGRRLYRRPLRADELDAYARILDAAADERRGIELVLEAMLQSPNFLYRTEMFGDDAQMTAHEAVSFLAFSVWNEGPDEALLTRADAGLDPEEVGELVDAVLDDPRATDVYSRFFVDWMDLEDVQAFEKPDDPRDSDELRLAMEDELAAFIDYVMNEGEGTQQELFSARYTVHDPRLAPIYGDVVANANGLVEHPKTERAGILTLPAWLASHAEPQRPTPIARGFFVRTRIMCQEMPPIPPGVDPMVPPPVPGETTRERYARHSSDPTCAGCHQLMDPLGFMFSHYDALGSYITEEQGDAVDGRGAVLGSQSFDGDYEDAVDMMAELAVSDDLTDCLSSQLYKFVYGRIAESNGDECSQSVLMEDYADTDGNVRALLRNALSRRLADAMRGGTDP